LEYDEYFDGLLEDYDIDSDPFGQDLLWEGWFDQDLDFEQRQEAREAFYEYMGMDAYDFDWEGWKDYMGYE
jgi:hypothetical protein